MPLSYLEGNPQDVYAINRLGSTFSDALLGMQANRMRAQQQAAQRALDAAYFRLAQEKSARDERLSNADIERLRADTSRLGAETKKYDAETSSKQEETKSFQTQRMSGEDMAFDMKQLNEVKDPDVQQFIRGLIAQQATKIAATNPQNIAQQSMMLQQGLDPKMQQLMATRTPLAKEVPAGGTLFDMASRKPMFQAPPRVTLRDPQQAQMDKLRTLAAVMGALNKPQLSLGEDPLMESVQGAMRGGLQDMGVGSGGMPSGANDNAGGTMNVISPDGTPGTIPAEDWVKAQAKGYKKAAQ